MPSTVSNYLRRVPVRGFEVTRNAVDRAFHLTPSPPMMAKLGVAALAASADRGLGDTTTMTRSLYFEIATSAYTADPDFWKAQADEISAMIEKTTDFGYVGVQILHSSRREYGFAVGLGDRGSPQHLPTKSLTRVGVTLVHAQGLIVVNVGQTVVIGRGIGGAGNVSDLSVSHEHAKVVCTGVGVATITDLGSTNQTLLNGVPLQATRAANLTDGAELCFGEFICTVAAKRQDGPAPTRAIRGRDSFTAPVPAAERLAEKPPAAAAAETAAGPCGHEPTVTFQATEIEAARLLALWDVLPAPEQISEKTGMQVNSLAASKALSGYVRAGNTYSRGAVRNALDVAEEAAAHFDLKV